MMQHIKQMNIPDMMKMYRENITSNDVARLMNWSRLSMKNLLEHASAPWIRYSSYEYKADKDNNLYI